MATLAQAPAAARTAAVPGVSVRHRQQMDRYDLALENNSRALAGSALLLVRVGTQPLDSLAFELSYCPSGLATT